MSSPCPEPVDLTTRPHTLSCPTWWAEELQPAAWADCTCDPDPPTPPLRTVAELARARDRIARQYRWAGEPA